MWPFNKSIRYAVRSPKWQDVRKQHLEKEPCCMACGSCIKPEVHHIIPVHIDNTKELDPNNLITLCDKYCHFIFGHLMNYKSWNTNVIQDSEEYLDKVLLRPKKNV